MAAFDVRETALAPSPNYVAISSVRKSFGRTEVLRGIDLTVSEGEVVVVLGPSGSGKTTLLRCINNLVPIDAGSIVVGGQLIGLECRGDRVYRLSPRQAARQRASIGFVFQSFRLFPHLSVLDNVIEGPIGVLKTPRGAAVATAKALLEYVGLADKLRAYPRQLSGGQQQRVAIARALAMEPKLMLFDEPTSALDPRLVGDVLDVIRKLAAGGMTMIVVTHEIPFAREVADRISFMEEGQIVEEGTPAELLRAPRTLQLQSFLRWGSGANGVKE